MGVVASIIGAAPTSLSGAARSSNEAPKSSSASYLPPSSAHPLLAAFYFGSGSPLNTWNTDLSGAPAAFEQIKREGFTAVALAVPWGEFQPSVNPPKYNATAFNRLDSLIALANSLKLQVVLRLSYEVDLYPNKQDPARFTSVFSDSTVYNAWLAYVSKVRQNTARFPNIKVAELSWEDFWDPVAAAQTMTDPSQRLQFATSSGFTSFLQKNYSLARISQMYGTTFTSWADVPTPLNTQSAFALVYQYDDWALVNRFFVPASARFPGLNLEARVEDDALFNGSARIPSYSHADQYRLPGTNYIGMYFDPYMGDPSTNTVESVSDAMTALQTTLSSMKSRSGGLPLYIFEYEIVSNSPVVSGAPGLSSDEVPQFILASEPLLHQYTWGYALWTYHDYNQSPIYNPSFSLGTSGWQVTGKATASSSPGGSSVTLGANSAISQQFSAGDLAGSAQKPITVSFSASTPGPPSTIKVNVPNAPVQTVTVGGRSQTYQVQIPGADLNPASPTAQLTITASAPVSLSDVEMYNFVQMGDIYSTTGSPESGASALATLNRQLTSGS